MGPIFPQEERHCDLAGSMPEAQDSPAGADKASRHSPSATALVSF